MLLRYQGLRRHYAVWFTRTGVQIVRQRYGEQVLAEAPLVLEERRAYVLEARVEGESLSVSLDGRPVLAARDAAFDCGGAGFAVARGLAGFRGLSITATTRPAAADGAG